jgi:two-component system alkaline phosphatase synthesis response regulator PhoP
MQKTKKIMVVDDHPHTCRAVKYLLENEGFKVTTASDGWECLNKLKTETPNLIIIDYLMPGMDGIQLCEKIRKDKKLRSLDVVIFSVARKELVGKEKLRKAHVSDYILKPFDNEDLVQRVKQVVCQGSDQNV